MEHIRCFTSMDTNKALGAIKAVLLNHKTGELTFFGQTALNQIAKYLFNYDDDVPTNLALTSPEEISKLAHKPEVNVSLCQILAIADFSRRRSR